MSRYIKIDIDIIKYIYLILFNSEYIYLTLLNIIKLKIKIDLKKKI